MSPQRQGKAALSRLRLRPGAQTASPRSPARRRLRGCRWLRVMTPNRLSSPQLVRASLAGGRRAAALAPLAGPDPPRPCWEQDASGCVGRRKEHGMTPNPRLWSRALSGKAPALPGIRVRRSEPDRTDSGLAGQSWRHPHASSGTPLHRPRSGPATVLQNNRGR